MHPRYARFEPKIIEGGLKQVFSLPSYVSFDNFESIFEYLNSLNRKLTIIIDEYPYLKK